MSDIRHNCCRLCLAPDNECISILNSCAADKEPIATKIHNCVSIRISSSDKLSLRICHACISYLNSWQSFKNRCIASQAKQRNWLGNDKRQQLLDNNVSITAIDGNEAEPQHSTTYEDYNQSQCTLASTILDGISSLKKRKSLTVYVSPKHQPKYSKQLLQTHQRRQLKAFKQQQKQRRPMKGKQKRENRQQCVAPTDFESLTKQLLKFRRHSDHPLPAVDIKDEPIDQEDDYMKHHDESDDMMDPTLFLERTEEEGDEPIMEASGYEYKMERVSVEAPSTTEGKEASCRACHLQFSTRANARRHEKNLHPHLFDTSTSTPNNSLMANPPPAFPAALELQRVAPNPAALTQQKFRQEVVNAFNQYETGGYDYDNPERYQHFLTDEKIVFLQQNDDFLQQFQNMTCRCCNKFYSTYKNFMAHMRKKYATLPRNLCFNCLKLNDSKAHFISHLKKRNCINLYKVLHALMAKNQKFAAAVSATTAAAPEKLRAKELLVNKMYECKLCSKKCRLKLDFRSHVYEAHADAQKKDISQTQCSYCAIKLEDPFERKRHYNNMECIVTLRCETCDSKFDTHQKFLDHVYSQHLAGYGHEGQQFDSTNSLYTKKTSGGSEASSVDESRHSQSGSIPSKTQYFSRMPQACPICGQQYNNYNNVLRHMESKHPDQLPQTYKCVKCGVGYPRLSNLREHMVTSHAADKVRHTGFEYIVNADAVKVPGATSSNVYTGRYDYVMKDLMSITNGGALADDDEGEESVSKKIKLDNSNSNTSNSGNQFNSTKECPICNAVFSNNIGLSNHMRSHTAAAQSAAAALAAAKKTPSLTITATSGRSAATLPQHLQSQQRTPAQQAVFKRSLEQAADRRFRRMRCRICQRRFSSKKSYRFHMLNDHQIRNVQFIKCKLCDAEFAYEKGLKVHMFKIHNTLLKDEMIIKQYECDICSIVYRTEDQLLQHKKTVHGNENAMADDFTDAGANSASVDVSGISTPVSGVIPQDRSTIESGVASGPLYWYQCKYCPANFNTNKKLAIHIKLHDEFDSTDYSCKDCGNVYSGRKSLWVHRYKKHPQIPEPSECVLCKKVFFDNQMLENHIPTCNRKPITATGAVAESTAGHLFKHKTGDDDEGQSHNQEDNGFADLDQGALAKIKLPEVSCTICGQRFTDQELFAKHIQFHEMEMYTDNPLAAMFDTGPADPNQFFLDRVNDSGQFACDLCQKTFNQMTALKVHRKWHFRGDSKQNLAEADPSANSAASRTQTQINHPHLLGLQAVGLMPNPQPNSKSLKRKRELTCEYCPSTFISNNNLRRHIYELHKEEIGNLPKPPKIELDPNLTCRRCGLKFNSKHEWIEHKVADARIMRPFGPFQWGCEMCGLYVSRKEKLINHIHNHMKEKEIVPADQNDETNQQLQNQNQQCTEAEEDNYDHGKEEEDDEDEEDYEEPLEGEGDDEEAEDDEAEDENGHDSEEAEEDEVGEEVGQAAAVNDGQQQYEEEEEDGDADDDGEADDDVEADDDGEADEEGDEDEDGEGDEEDSEVEEDEDVEEDGEVDIDGVGVEGDEYMNDDETNESGIQLGPEITIKSINNDNSAESSDSDDSRSEAGDDDDDEDGDADGVNDNDYSRDGVEDEDNDTASSAEQPKPRYSCDLCQVFFDTQQELQKHVKMHFLNGPGSVTLGELKSKSLNKSRSSSSDVVAVSSS